MSVVALMGTGPEWRTSTVEGVMEPLQRAPPHRDHVSIIYVFWTVQFFYELSRVV